MNARVEWRKVAEGLVPVVVRGLRSQRAAWAPQPGSQTLFLSCPLPEALYEGNRGPGKTDALLMDFAQHVGQGWGPEWRGVLFRKTYPDLEDVITKSRKWFRIIWPEAQFNEAQHFWEWPSGERLYFRHFKNEAAYWNYHGHAYPWIGWEELCTWPTPACYLSMFSCSRAAVIGMPRKVRATANPYGVGHNWVKLRFRLPVSRGRVAGPVIRDSRDRAGELEPPRVAIHGHLSENKILLHADPGYIQRLRASAKSQAQLDAWLDGSWDIVAGGMFDDVWDERVHWVTPFEIPGTWRIDRAFDWGSSHPFSVGWWAESDGSDVKTARGWCSTVRGDLFRIHEWYGWREGHPNEGLKLTDDAIAKGIIERELQWGIYGRVKPGPAGSDIFSETNGSSTERNMARSVTVGGKVYQGVHWIRADNRPGSRVQGWKEVRERLENAKSDGRPREKPGLFIFDRCEQFRRTVPVLPRSEKNLDDVDTEAEDHCGDEVRYRITLRRPEARSTRTGGAQ